MAFLHSLLIVLSIAVSPVLQIFGVQESRNPTAISPIPALSFRKSLPPSSYGAVPAANAGSSTRQASGPAPQRMMPDRLVVTKIANNLDNPTAPPFSKTITDPTVVQKLYSDILALPPFPLGTYSCPPDIGIQYNLDFYLGAVSILTADYDPTGCASLKLNDRTVKTDATRGFEVDLAEALGLSEAQFLGFQ
jgi:hypothetical protein